MNIRTASCVTSSLNAAAFRTVLASNGRELAYRLRREIMTMRRLHQDPLPAGLAYTHPGCIRTSRDIQTMTSRKITGK